MSTMKKILRFIIDNIAFLIYRNKVSITGQNVKFYRTTSIKHIAGSISKNIILKQNARIMGKIRIYKEGKIVIGKYSQLGHNSVIQCVNQIEIGDYTAIAQNVTICDYNTHPVNPSDRIIMQLTPEGHSYRSPIYSVSAPIKIGNNCWIGENSRICKGISIGDGAVIAACSVVTKDVPSNSIAAGNPAKIVKTDIDKSTTRFFSNNV